MDVAAETPDRGHATLARTPITQKAVHLLKDTSPSFHLSHRCVERIDASGLGLVRLSQLRHRVELGSGVMRHLGTAGHGRCQTPTISVVTAVSRRTRHVSGPLGALPAGDTSHVPQKGQPTHPRSRKSARESRPIRSIGSSAILNQATSDVSSPSARGVPPEGLASNAVTTYAVSSPFV